MTYKEALDRILMRGERIADGEKFEDPKILRLANEWGWTVAHQQAWEGWTTEDPDILRLADKRGWTIAHQQASRGWTTEDPELLRLANAYGSTVAHEQVNKGWEPKTKAAKIYVLTERLKE